MRGAWAQHDTGRRPPRGSWLRVSCPISNPCEQTCPHLREEVLSVMDGRYAIPRHCAAGSSWTLEKEHKHHWTCPLSSSGAVSWKGLKMPAFPCSHLGNRGRRGACPVHSPSLLCFPLLGQGQAGRQQKGKAVWQGGKAPACLDAPSSPQQHPQ